MAGYIGSKGSEIISGIDASIPDRIIKSTRDVDEEGLVTEEGSAIVIINTTADFSFGALV